MSVAGVRANIVAAAAEASGAAGAITEAHDPHLNAIIEHFREVIEEYLPNAAGGLENAAASIAAANEDGSEELSAIYAQYERLHDEDMPAMIERLKEARDRVYATLGQMEAVRGEIYGAIEQAAEYAARL
jgi:hypothetical protein